MGLGPKNITLLCFMVISLLASPPSSVASSPNSGSGICSTSVIRHGYKCQEFDVVTPDGYILNVIRIPEGLVQGGGGGGVGSIKQPVLIQHGVLLDGMSWLLNSPEQDLPFILADNGFDVWISNTRGTRFSRRHVSLDPSDQKYWNWSWDELAASDLPSIFNFIHGQTGNKINYVGHSLGTLTALASLSEGRIVDKIRSAALLSPVAYLRHMTTPLGVVAAKFFLGEITTLFGLAELNPKMGPMDQLLKILCAYPGVDCYDLLGSITGKNCCLNSSTVDIYLKNAPQSTSTKNMVHLSQIVRDGVLTKYDYGIGENNLNHYGKLFPPAYNLSNIPVDLPMFMSYGERDALSDVADVEHLLHDLRFHNRNRLTVQRVKDYAHADFVMAVNAKDVVYSQVVAFFKNQW